jgi:hypothetical protein
MSYSDTLVTCSHNITTPSQAFYLNDCNTHGNTLIQTAPHDYAPSQSLHSEMSFGEEQAVTRQSLCWSGVIRTILYSLDTSYRLILNNLNTFLNLCLEMFQARLENLLR